MKATLEQICSVIVDCEHKTSPIDESGEYFAVGTPAMRGNVIDYAQARRISLETFEQWTRRLRPAKGDLLFAREAPVGPIVSIPDSENIAPGQRTVLMRINPAIADPTFLYYLISSPLEQARIQALAAGSTVAHLNVADIRSFEVELPTLLEQQAIAEVLGALDDKIATNTKLAATAHKLASVIYGQSTSSLNVIPMSTVLSPVLGGTPPRSRADYWVGDQLWASAKDITGAEFSTLIDTDEKISLSAVEKTKAKPLPVGSVILTARGTVGTVARLAAPASFNQSCYGFVPGEIPPGVLYFSIIDATERAKAIAHGSVFDTITMKTFEHLSFPEFIGNSMANTESKIAPLLDSITAAVLENKRLAATRDALLPQLMSGKLRVKDAESLISATV